MSFTNGKPRVATEKDCVANWSGSRNGLRFRCKLCGYRFKPGDRWRFIWANIPDSPTRTGNFTVCRPCDDKFEAKNELILQEMAKLEEEAYTRFWWLVEDDNQLRRWTDGQPV